MDLQTINKVFVENARKFSGDAIIKYKKDKGGEFLDFTWAELDRAAHCFAFGLITARNEPRGPDILPCGKPS